MGQVLSFPQRSAVGSRRNGSSGRSAEIVFFSGVRYERPDGRAAGTAATPDTPPADKRRTDRGTA